MRRPTALLLLATVATLALLAGCAKPPATPRRPPSVLLLVLDAVRADHMGWAGYARPTTPNLDLLAREGVWFADAFAAATWTKPSIGAVYTGRFPSELGLLDADFTSGRGATLDPRFPLLPESFATGGWRSLAVVNQVHISRPNGFARGFSPFLHFAGRNAGFLNGKLLQTLDRDPEKKPFFAYVHYLDAHWPYDPVPDGQRRDFGSGEFAVKPPRDLEGVLAWQKTSLDEAARQALISRYDAEIRGLDTRLGELFEELRRRGRWDDTIVVVTADHGEGFAEHGKLLHGFLPYVEVSRVPLLVHPPAGAGWQPGRRATPVSLVDLVPTFLDLAGLPPIPDARGRSLRPLLESDRASDNLVLTQAEGGWALRGTGETLLVQKDGTRELFDRRADPAELAPLAAAAATDPRFARLDAQMQRLRRLLVRVAGAGRERELTKEETERLRSLGYL